MSSLLISKNADVNGNASLLPSSKSISNRALILNALSGNTSDIRNLSTARDTQLMQALIDSPDKVIDIMDAGTTMRFLTAYFSLTGKNKVITGSERMKQRPIALLVNALREIGVTIHYQEKEHWSSTSGKKAGGSTVCIVMRSRRDWVLLLWWFSWTGPLQRGHTTTPIETIRLNWIPSHLHTRHHRRS